MHSAVQELPDKQMTIKVLFYSLVLSYLSRTSGLKPIVQLYSWTLSEYGQQISEELMRAL